MQIRLLSPAEKYRENNKISSEPGYGSILNKRKMVRYKIGVYTLPGSKAIGWLLHIGSFAPEW
jgi:hypothetical protein